MAKIAFNMRLFRFGKLESEGNLGAAKKITPRYQEGGLLNCVAVKDTGDFDMTWALIKSGIPVVHNLNAVFYPKDRQPKSQDMPVTEVFTSAAGYAGVAMGHLRFGATPEALLTHVEPNKILEPGETIDHSNVTLFQRSVLELLARDGRKDLVDLYRKRMGALKPLRAGYSYDNFRPPHLLLTVDLSLAT